MQSQQQQQQNPQNITNNSAPNAQPQEQVSSDQQQQPLQQSLQNQPDHQSSQQQQNNNSSAMQNQMLQLISQMAAQAQEPSTGMSPTAAMNATFQNEFQQQPAPQVQGQSIPQQQQTVAMNKVAQAASANQTEKQVDNGQQNIQGGAQHTTAAYTFANTNPNAANQVIQGGIHAQGQSTSSQEASTSAAATQQQLPPGASINAQAQSQQQTMETLISAINQQLKQPQQQSIQPQQVPQQFQASAAAATLNDGNSQQQQWQQPQQPGGANSQIQIVEILGQITKSLNTIKQAQIQQQNQGTIPQQPSQTQQQQQPPIPQAVTAQSQQSAPSSIQAANPQQNFTGSQQQQQQQPWPQQSSNNNVNQILLQLLSTALQPQAQTTPAQPQQQQLQIAPPSIPQQQQQVGGGGLPPPQPYQHEALGQIGGGATAGIDHHLAGQSLQQQQTNFAGQQQQQPEAAGGLASNMASLLQQMVSQQSSSQQSGQPGQAAGLIPPGVGATTTSQGQPQQHQNSGTAATGEVLGEPLFIKFFVGGVLYSAKEGDVEAYFKRFGEVVDVSIMRDNVTGRSRGFAFVTFKEQSTESINALRQSIFDPTGAAAPANPQQTTSERNERGDRGRNRRDRSPHGSRQGGDQRASNTSSNNNNKNRGANRSSEPNSGNTNSGNNNNNRRRRSRSRDRSRGPTKAQEEQLSQGVREKVFVGGLDYGLTDQDFLAHFQIYGQVKEAQIVRDPISGQSRGFGFVTYLDVNVAQKLINEMTHTKIAGRKVDLRKAELKTSDKMAILNKSSGGDAGRASNQNGSHGQKGNDQSNQAPGPGHHQNNNGGGKKDGGGNNNRFGSKYGSEQSQGGGGGRNRMRGSNSQPRSQGGAQNNNNSQGNQNQNFAIAQNNLQQYQNQQNSANNPQQNQQQQHQKQAGNNKQIQSGNRGRTDRRSSDRNENVTQQQNNQQQNHAWSSMQDAGGQNAQQQDNRPQAAARRNWISHLALDSPAEPQQPMSQQKPNQGGQRRKDSQQNQARNKLSNQKSQAQADNLGAQDMQTDQPHSVTHMLKPPHQSKSGGTVTQLPAPPSFTSAYSLGKYSTAGEGQGGLVGPYTAFERQHNLGQAGAGDGSGRMHMTQSITQLFSNSHTGGGGAGNNPNSGKALADDGGYAKPVRAADPFGVSHAISHATDHFGGSDFAKVDFDKPLFGGSKDTTSDPVGMGEQQQPMTRSLYSSSSSNKQQTAGQDHHAASPQLLMSKDVGIRTNMPLASEISKQQQKPAPGHDFHK